MQPELNETVWLYSENTGRVFLGYLTYFQDEGVFWAAGHVNDIYSDGTNIIADCEIDDVDVTHFARLPKLPNKQNSKQ